MTRIEKFSGGYYRAEMTVQPLDDGPSIERGLYDLLDRRIYQNTDTPVMMRASLDVGPRFVPSVDTAMPTDVIGLPTHLLDEVGIHPSAQDVSIFILTPKHAHMLSQQV